jgi:hypothetical protein
MAIPKIRNRAFSRVSMSFSILILGYESLNVFALVLESMVFYG